MWSLSGRRHIILAILGIGLTGSMASGQLEPLSNQYHFNTLAINPAYTGNREALSITLLHRNQWTGFEGGPRTQTLSMHAPMRGDRVGLGILAMNDRAGVAGMNTFSTSFAYRIRMDEGVFSLGLGAGITSARNNYQNLVAVNNNDALIPVTTQNYLLPDFSIGLYYYTEQLFLGVSLPFFLTHQFDGATGSFDLVNDYAEYTYFFNGGYLLKLSSRWKILPSAMIRFTPVATPQADLNIYAIYNDRFWAGISYRSNRSLVGLFLFQVNNQLAIAYSYDLGVGDIGRYMGGSHEIMIRYDFRYIIDVIDPRYF